MGELTSTERHDAIKDLVGLDVDLATIERLVNRIRNVVLREIRVLNDAGRKESNAD